MLLSVPNHTFHASSFCLIEGRIGFALYLRYNSVYPWEFIEEHVDVQVVLLTPLVFTLSIILILNL